MGRIAIKRRAHRRSNCAALAPKSGPRNQTCGLRGSCTARLNSALDAIPTGRLAWLLPVAFAFHELEEWNIAEWYLRYWTNVDPAMVNQRNSWTWLVFASFVGFLWTLLAVCSRNPKVTFHLLLVLFIPVFSHSLAHVYWLFSLGVYAPGVVTSVVFIIPFTAYVTFRAIRDGLVSSVYAVILFALTLPPIAWAIQLDNRLPDGGIPFLRFSAWLANLLFPQVT